MFRGGNLLGSALHLLEAVLQPFLQQSHFLALGGEHGLVEVDKVEEGLGRCVVVPPLRRLEVLRRCVCYVLRLVLRLSFAIIWFMVDGFRFKRYGL